MLERTRGRLAALRMVIVLVAWGGAVMAQAADQPERSPSAGPQAPSRPRIGLVLSGGGARGAAHAGVIRALEQMRVPIDAIAGTSMGAVVGGLYAAGLDGTEIENVFHSLDWQDLTRDRAPRRDLVYRRKQDDRNILAKGSLGVNEDGVVLPLGLLQGQKITQLLRRAALRVADVDDFDKLPTPFRALATDLETGDPVVLHSGDLATVMRASMSAPGVLAPVEIDGRLLVDGGLADNLPVRLAREMGVDVLIVVDVSFPLAQRDDIQSPIDVTNQMIGILVRRGTLASKALLQKSDVLIEPNLGRMTSLDFSHMPEVIEAGAAAVAKAQERLAALALPPTDYARYVAARSRPKDPSVQLAFVRPGPGSEQDKARVDAVFGDMAGKPLDTPAIQKRMVHEYGLDRYEMLDYRIVTDGDDKGLEVDMHRKSWGPAYLRLGVGLQSDYSGGASANLGAQMLITGLNRLDAEWLTDLQLGEEPLFATEWFQPLSLTGPFFVAPGFKYSLSSFEVIEDGKNIARDRVLESQFSFALGAELSNWGELRAGLRRGIGNAQVLIGDPAPRHDFDIGGAFVQFGYDQLDSAYFPKHGQAFRLNWIADRESLGSTTDADVVRASWQIARSLDRDSIVLSIDAGSALHDHVNSPQELFRLGGLFDLSGLAPDTLTGTQYGIARAIVYRKVSRGGTGFFEFPAYVGFSVEAGNTWQKRSDVAFGDLVTAGSLFLAAETPFGPVYLATGLAEGGRKALYLYLGKTF